MNDKANGVTAPYDQVNAPKVQIGDATKPWAPRVRIGDATTPWTPKVKIGDATKPW